MGTWPKTRTSEQTTFGGLNRSILMSRIRGSGNASTEIKFLLLLRGAKIRGWRRNYPLLGKPDFSFPKHKLVVFLDGCFWHAHGCTGRMPNRNTKHWVAKFARNKKRDLFVTKQLKIKGWRVVRIWECDLATRPTWCLQRVRRAICSAGEPPNSGN